MEDYQIVISTIIVGVGLGSLYSAKFYSRFLPTVSKLFDYTDPNVKLNRPFKQNNDLIKIVNFEG